ncbi:Gfo/Idh/MocA family protein [Arthrobacter sp. NPDC057013]|uniref:Gfo/Idh/MocA family protein n=1 Tax=Arthrobacter sp. NPDC057013 TaxID=3345999 RepID=UPI003642A982
MKHVKIALMGAGLIGREHARFLKANQEAELAGIADPAPSAKQLAAELNVPHFSDYEDLLSQVSLDGAIVALPNSMHREAGIACIRAGIPTLIEKPVADTAEAALAIIEAADAADVPVLIGHQRRHSPDIVRAKQLISGGQLGQIVTVNGMCQIKKENQYFENLWRQQPGGGPILINLIHDIDTLRYLIGDIQSVLAVTSNNVRKFAVEDTAAVILKFANGSLGTLLLSDSVASPWCWDLNSGQGAYFPHTPADAYHIGGTEGSLAIPSMKLYRHANSGDWHDPLIVEQHEIAESHAYAAQLQHFLDIIKTGAEPLIGARDGLMTLAATLGVGRSAAENREVFMDELLPMAEPSV